MTISKHTGKAPAYVVCIDNSDYPASLKLHKLYRFIPDEDSGADSDLRIVDESGDDDTRQIVSRVSMARQLARSFAIAEVDHQPASTASRIHK